jgi:hypothetical protein
MPILNSFGESPESEIKAWFNHSVDFVQQRTKDPQWINTGILLRVDIYLLEAYTCWFQHPVPVVMAFEDNNFFESLSSMISARRGTSVAKPRLPT